MEYSSARKGQWVRYIGVVNRRFAGCAGVVDHRWGGFVHIDFGPQTYSCEAHFLTPLEGRELAIAMAQRALGIIPELEGNEKIQD